MGNITVPWSTFATHAFVEGQKMPKTNSTILYRSGYKYQVYSPYTHKIGVNNMGIFEDAFFRWHDVYLTIKAGYAWDGPSGLTWDTDTFMRGSLVHDAMYQLMRMGAMSNIYREEADKLLRDICIEDGMWRFRANYVYRAVRRCGKKYTEEAGLKETKTAP